jgi:hypothetical protein
MSEAAEVFRDHNAIAESAEDVNLLLQHREGVLDPAWLLADRPTALTRDLMGARARLKGARP